MVPTLSPAFFYLWSSQESGLHNPLLLTEEGKLTPTFAFTPSPGPEIPLSAAWLFWPPFVFVTQLKFYLLKNSSLFLYLQILYLKLFADLSEPLGLFLECNLLENHHNSSPEG